MEAWEEFSHRLAMVGPLRLARDQSIADGDGDLPCVLLGALGNTIAEQFDNFSQDEAIFIFKSIEEGMKTTDQVLRDCLATGLLEAVQSRAQRLDSTLWKRIKGCLGEESKAYLKAWDKIWGILEEDGD